MKGPVEKGVVKKETAALGPALGFSTNNKLTRRGHFETCIRVNVFNTLCKLQELFRIVF